MGQSTGALIVGAFAVLVGAGGIAAALRRRRGRAAYEDTYASSGGIVYTSVQVGCSAVFILGGLGLLVLGFLTAR